MPIGHVTLARDGRVVLPAAQRHELGLRPGDTLTVESDGTSLLLRNLADVLREDHEYGRTAAGAG